MKKGDILYYARIIPNVSYDVYELKVRAIYDTYFVGVEKFSKQAFLLYYTDLEKIIFNNRKTALSVVRQAEKNKNKIFTEVYYEED